MIPLVPTSRLAAFVAVGALVLFLTPVDVLSSAALALGLVLIVALVADWVTMPAPKELRASRAVADRLSLGAENLVAVTIENESDWPLAGVLRDLPPPEFDCAGAATPVRADRRGSLVYRYHVLPPRRGHYAFGDLYLRTTGVLGLLARQTRFEAARTVEVYPNIKAVTKYQLLARKGALLEMGIKSVPISGRGTNFESLREYQPDDEFRFIDWKATARTGKPITQVHEVERAQNIILALDAGRMMTPQIGGITKLDRSVNAALMVAYVAIASGDNVGLLVFGREIQRFVAPGRGRRQIRTILQALHAVDAEMNEPDYARALKYLAAKASRRSLVVIFTDLWGKEASQRLVSAITNLHPRHLPLCVTLRDPSIEQMLRVRPANTTDVYAQAVGEQLLVDREDARRTMQSRGTLVLDAAADEFSVAAVNKYLEVKTAGLL